MRWKQKVEKRHPKAGTTRVVRKFLLSPTAFAKAENYPWDVGREVRWLETAYILQEHFLTFAGWWSKRWATKEEYDQQSRDKDDSRRDWWATQDSCEGALGR